MMVRWSGERQVNVSGMSGERQISIWAWHWWTWNLFFTERCLWALGFIVAHWERINQYRQKLSFKEAFWDISIKTSGSITINRALLNAYNDQSFRHIRKHTTHLESKSARSRPSVQSWVSVLPITDDHHSNPNSEMMLVPALARLGPGQWWSLARVTSCSPSHNSGI